MEAKDIRSLNDCKDYLEGCINDFEGGVSTNEETLMALMEYGENNRIGVYGGEGK